MRTSSYIIDVPVPDEETSLFFHGYSGAVDLVSKRVAHLLLKRDLGGAGLADHLSRETLSSLRAGGYLTRRTPEAERAYVVELGRRVHAVTRKYAPPGFLVVPTYGCNLQCPYCYQRDLLKKGASWLEQRLSEEMAQAALEGMDTMAGRSLRPRTLTLYGGEPLQESNGPLIRLLHEEAWKRGFRRFSAITNAVDLHHFSDLLGQDRGISFLQVTIDGPPSLHDRRRFLKDGRGTFERIVHNITLAMNRGVTVSVRVNVDRANAHQVEWLRSFFQERGWHRTPLFRAYCSPVHGGIATEPAGGCFRSHAEMRRAIRGSRTTREDDHGSPTFQTDTLTHAIRKRILAHLLQRQDLPLWRTAFCGSNMAMYLFDPFGDIYPCWEVIGHAEHRIGVYGPGFFELDKDAVHRWHHRSVVQIPACRSCPYLFFCGGGCEAFAYRATGRFDQPHCFDFPEHFRKAALLAYKEWKVRRRTGNPSA